MTAHCSIYIFCNYELWIAFTLVNIVSERETTDADLGAYFSHESLALSPLMISM